MGVEKAAPVCSPNAASSPCTYLPARHVKPPLDSRGVGALRWPVVPHWERW